MLERTLPIPEIPVGRRTYQWVVASLVVAGSAIGLITAVQASPLTGTPGSRFGNYLTAAFIVFLVGLLGVCTLGATDQLRLSLHVHRFCRELAEVCRTDRFDITAATMQPVQGAIRASEQVRLELAFPDNAARCQSLLQLMVTKVADTNQLPQLGFRTVKVTRVGRTLVLIRYSEPTDVYVPDAPPFTYLGRYVPTADFCTFMVERTEDQQLAGVNATAPTAAH